MNIKKNELVIQKKLSIGIIIDDNFFTRLYNNVRFVLTILAPSIIVKLPLKLEFISPKYWTMIYKVAMGIAL